LVNDLFFLALSRMIPRGMEIIIGKNRKTKEIALTYYRL